MLKINRKRLFSLFTFFIITISLIFLSSINGALAEDNNGNVYIDKGEVIEKNFFQAGGTIDFNGQAEKDVIVTGGTINIQGSVKGDVLASGGIIRIDGDVEGNVRMAGGTLEINGKVGKNVNVFGGTVIIGENSEIAWDVLVFAGNIEIRGKILGNIKGGGGNVIIAGEIGGDVDLKVDGDKGNLILYPEALIKGNLNYTSSKELEIREGAEVMGEITYNPIVKSITSIKQDFGAYFSKGLGTFLFVVKIISLLGLLIIGLIIILLARKTSRSIGEIMTEKPWASIGRGLVYLIVTPVVLLLVSITIIGLPLSAIGLIIYLILLYVSKIFVGLVLGQKILRWVSKKKEVSPVWSMILGVIVFSVITSIPFVGWIISILGICLALGAIVEIKKKTFKQIEG